MTTCKAWAKDMCNALYVKGKDLFFPHWVLPIHVKIAKVQELSNVEESVKEKEPYKKEGP